MSGRWQPLSGYARDGDLAALLEVLGDVLGEPAEARHVDEDRTAVLAALARAGARPPGGSR